MEKGAVTRKDRSSTAGTARRVTGPHACACRRRALCPNGRTARWNGAWPAQPPAPRRRASRRSGVGAKERRAPSTASSDSTLPRRPAPHAGQRPPAANRSDVPSLPGQFQERRAARSSPHPSVPRGSHRPPGSHSGQPPLLPPAKGSPGPRANAAPDERSEPAALQDDAGPDGSDPQALPAALGTREDRHSVVQSVAPLEARFCAGFPGPALRPAWTLGSCQDQAARTAVTGALFIFLGSCPRRNII